MRFDEKKAAGLRKKISCRDGGKISKTSTGGVCTFLGKYLKEMFSPLSRGTLEEPALFPRFYRIAGDSPAEQYPLKIDKPWAAAGRKIRQLYTIANIDLKTI